MRYPTLVLFTLALACPIALAGSVETLDGKRLEGALTLDADTQLVINHQGQTTRLPLDRTLRVLFADPIPSSQPRILLRSGSTIVGAVRRADESALVIQPTAGKELSLPTTHIAAILFRTQDPNAPSLPKAPRKGAMLDNGDFFEGDFKGISGSQVRINSVLFGLKRFDINRNLVAITLRPVEPTPTRHRVRLKDGTLLRVQSLTMTKDGLSLDEPAVGKLTVRPEDLAEISAGDTRFSHLSSLKPTHSQGQFELDATLAGVPMDLAGTPFTHGISLAPNASLAYKLDGACRMFLCRAGVPRSILPTATVRFIVLIDGKERYRSDPRTSLSDPLTLTLPLDGASELELRLESDPATPFAEGLWADAALLK